jgi:NADPH:quinone reductase-like Zn-dependent oxidoreductase
LRFGTPANWFEIIILNSRRIQAIYLCFITNDKKKSVKMKAIEYAKYGAPEVLEIKEVEKPIPKNNEILIRIEATSVTATECTFRKGKPYFSRLFTGLTKPRIRRLGEELAGRIEAVGTDVEQYKLGDEVFGTAGPNFGANAEYICVSEDAVLATKPTNVTFAEAATSVDGFLTALPFLRDIGQIRQGQQVLIYGASGSVGSAAVQIAKHFGAEVTAVCSTANTELVRRIGADLVVDYKKEDFTKNGSAYDIIFDAVGKTTFAHCKKSLKANGVFLEAGIGLGIFRHVIWTSLFAGKKAKIAATGLRAPHLRKNDLQLLKELLEKKIMVPVIDRSYPLEQIAEAHAYVDKGHKKGNVAIVI